MEKIKVKPAQGATVYDELGRKIEGETEVKKTVFIKRLIKDGDLIEIKSTKKTGGKK